MHCRKCGCEILETDTRCPMCDTLQKGKVKRKKNESVSGVRSGASGVGHGQKILIAMGIVLIAVLIALLINNNDGRSSRDRTSAPEIPLLWDFGSRERLLMNQMNRNAVIEMRLFMGDAATYMMMQGTGTIFRTTNDFATYEHLITPSPIMFSFNMVNGHLYYRAPSESDRSIFALYRYNIQTGQSTEIFVGVDSEVIINHLVFHQSGHHERLYVFNMETNEREELIDREIRTFIVDYPTDRLFFIDHDYGLYQAKMDGSNQIRIHDRVLSFAFNGDVLALSTLEGSLYIYDLLNMIGEEHPTDQRLMDLMFVGQYLAGRDRQDTLHLLDLEDFEAQWELIHNISSFASMGNDIMYTQWESDEIRRMDLFGQSEFVRKRWEQ